MRQSSNSYSNQSLKEVLDRFYSEYDFEGRISRDPIEFPHKYNQPADIEISGIIASCFAYGRVDLFKPVVKAVLSPMGSSPRDFLLDFSLKQRSLFSGLNYRFNKNDDILCLLYGLAEVLRKYGSIERLFKLHYQDSDLDIGNGLTGFVKTILDFDTSVIYGKNVRTRGFLQFFPLPDRGSACKRMNLFLRWMIRDRDIDFGIWKGIPKSRLIIPLDTHIARISRCLGFTKRSSQDWKTAVEITDALKAFDPNDPLKYDFALCHQGISGLCDKMRCRECAFRIDCY